MHLRVRRLARFAWERARGRLPRRRAMHASTRRPLRQAERSNAALRSPIVLGITIPVLSLCRATVSRDLI